MKLINVTCYTPEEKPYGDDAVYFIDENGLDFYASIGLFTKKYKLCIEPDTGIIRSISEDVSSFYPGGFTVIETDNLPAGCDISGGWFFDGKKITPRMPSHSELIATAESQKDRLMQAASDAIAPLQDAVDPDIDIATDEEKAQLLAWRKYRVLLNRVNTSTAPDIVWPDMPE
ncbi:tail fiber assembly protein [Escherichia coli]